MTRPGYFAPIGAAGSTLIAVEAFSVSDLERRRTVAVAVGVNAFAWKGRLLP